MDYAIDRKEGEVPPLKFSASRAEQLMACPGSANLELSIPGWVPPVVDENAGAKGKGKELHAYLEKTSELSARDLRALAEALSYMADLRSQRRFHILTEDTQECFWLKTKPKTTVDVVLWTADQLEIVDYKTGVIQVEAYENPQGMFYALNYLALAPKAKEVTIHIVQPWAKGGSSKWTVTRDRLMLFMKDAQRAEQEILNNSTRLSPGDHCKFCPADPHSRSDKGKPLCPVRMKMLYPDRVDESAILALEVL